MKNNKMLHNAPISKLSLIILNDRIDSNLRKNASIELKHRFRNIGFKYEDFLHKEKQVIDIRGLNINNYLICDEPSVQQLLETYFNYYYNDDKLLFSEIHLCSEGSTFSKLFSNIKENEKERLGILLYDDTYDIDDLREFNIMLTNRKKSYYKDYHNSDKTNNLYNKILDKLEYNDAFQYLNQLSDNKILNITNNLKEDDEINKIKKGWYSLADFALKHGLGLYILFDLYGIKKVLEDSHKLSKQRKSLDNQSYSSISVDYRSSKLQKVLKNKRT